MNNAPSSAAALDYEQMAQAEMQRIAERARTVGELKQLGHERIRELLTNDQSRSSSENGDGATLDDYSALMRQQLLELLQKQVNEMDQATEGFEEVNLKDLPPGENGNNVVGADASTANVSRDLVGDTEEMKQTLIHEAHEDVGHTSQAAPKTAGEVALIVDGEDHDVVTVLEGDVERGTAVEMGNGPEAHREGQPEEHYGEGQDMANEVIDMVGENTWNQHLKKDGEYGDLQGEIWKQALDTGTDIQTIADQAKKTGYQQEASEVIVEHITGRASETQQATAA